MKIKKILSAFLVVIIVLQCASFFAFAQQEAVASEFENVYALVQNDSDGYGYTDYSFVDENGNVFDLESKEEKSYLDGSSAYLQTQSTVPAKYSLKDYGLITDVRNQGLAESCWAFSVLGALESNHLVQGKGKDDFSEAHLVWFAQNSATTDTSSPVYGDGFNRSDAYGIGGNWMLAVAALSRWAGTVKESDYPFYPYSLSRMGNYAESERHNTSGGTILYSAESLNTLLSIKTWIMEKGAVEANFHYDDKYLNETSDKCNYYCNDASLTSNHAILIVGWDDNYSISNFKSSLRPSNPGAFLCRNSWTDAWGEDGYFWISYYDATIGGMIGYTGVESDTYDNNYTYNGLGYGAAYKVTSSYGSQVANVFTSGGYETLSAISTYTIIRDTYAEVFIYKNLSANYSKPNQGTLVYSSSKMLLSNPGYHTIPINNPVSLSPNEVFSVVIRFSSSSKEVYIVAEYDQSSLSYSSKSRQSYVDTSGTGSKWTDMVSMGYDNNCIQAFTVCNHQSCEIETPATCTTNGLIINCCSQCGEQFSSRVIEAVGHSFGEWETTKQPDYISDGENTRVCRNCSDTEKEAIPRLVKISSRRVTPDKFIEILKKWIENFFLRIAERYNKKGFRSY